MREDEEVAGVVRPLIWWLCQADCEAITPESEDTGFADSPAGWPEYLRDQYESRRGRPGRGRLWLARETEKAFGKVSVSPWPDTPLALLLGGDYGGIVIRPEDAALVRDLPGILTDTSLRRVS